MNASNAKQLGPRIVDVLDLSLPSGHYAYATEHGGVIYAVGQLGRGRGTADESMSPSPWPSLAKGEGTDSPL